MVVIGAATYGISKKGVSLQVLRILRVLTIGVDARYQLPPLIVIVITNIFPHDVCATPSVR